MMTVAETKAYLASTVPPPDPDPILVRLEKAEAEIVTLKSQFTALSTAVAKNTTENATQAAQIIDLHQRVSVLEAGFGNTVTVRANERFPLFIIVGHDAACENEDPPDNDPPGKPIMGHPPMGERVYLEKDEEIEIDAEADVSCKCDKKNPWVKTPGAILYGVVAEGQKGAGLYLPKSKVTVLD